MKKIRYFEVMFDDGYSICILGRDKPTYTEAQEFCEKMSEECSPVIDVRELNEEEAHTFFSMDNEYDFSIFEKQEEVY